MARSLLCLGLACGLAALVAASEAEEDNVVLLQVGTLLKPQRSDACQCLSWKDVYAKHGVECGAQELVWAGGMVAKPMLGKEFCTRFYEKISGNFCTQLYFSHQRTEQWCYVSSECQSLNGGGALGSLKWKQCRTGEDTMLGEMAPAQVHKVAETEELDAGLVLKMAYPVYTQGLKWPDVQKCLRAPSPASGTTCTALKEVQSAGKPMIFDSLSGHPPFGVVVGSRATESHFTPWLEQNYKNETVLWATPSKMNAYDCVAGCDQ